MAQQTAVEWLFQKMTEQGTNAYWDMRFIQAKQMEKEQIMDARLSTFDLIRRDDVLKAEQYYSEIYNNESNI